MSYIYYANGQPVMLEVDEDVVAVRVGRGGSGRRLRSKDALIWPENASILVGFARGGGSGMALILRGVFSLFSLATV
jgi:hypothetical protein